MVNLSRGLSGAKYSISGLSRLSTDEDGFGVMVKANHKVLSRLSSLQGSPLLGCFRVAERVMRWV